MSSDSSSSSSSSRSSSRGSSRGSKGLHRPGPWRLAVRHARGSSSAWAGPRSSWVLSLHKPQQQRGAAVLRQRLPPLLGRSGSHLSRSLGDVPVKRSARAAALAEASSGDENDRAPAHGKVIGLGL